MRLFSKLFLSATLVLSVALLLSGYLLITSAHEGAIVRERDRALNQYQYDKFTVQAALISETAGSPYPLSQDVLLFSRLAKEVSGQVAFFSEDRTLLYSDLSTADFSLVDSADDNALVYAFQNVGATSYIFVCGKLTQGDTALYLLIATDISRILAQKEWMLQNFASVHFITFGLSILLIFLFSLLLTRPMQRMTKAAERIAHGEYSDRLPPAGNDEIGALSKSFNLMADAVEEKIIELSRNARQKEDFVASFAHELKTPLTSVIGYADLLYQKTLPPEQVKAAAWYIVNEGLRLETLSLKLMDLIVLGRRDFVLSETAAQPLLESIILGLQPLFAEKNVTPHLKVDAAYLYVEYDLFKTLLLNLIDNAVKAGASDVWISGKQKGNRYRISIADNGQGIPEADLNRITEAFYRVDKSRSRKQHGAGLGLSLCAKIAEIHGTTLHFQSREKAGTVVSIDLTCKGGALDA